jgi:hypothetical protein
LAAPAEEVGAGALGVEGAVAAGEAAEALTLGEALEELAIILLFP